MTTIRIGHLSTGYHTALCAIALKAPEHAGLDPVWRLFGTGPPIVKALEEGELDIGYIGLPPAVIGIARGAAIRCVAGGHMDGTVLIARAGYKDSTEAGSIQAALDQFAGKKIGSPSRGSIHDVILRAFLARHGLEEKVEVENFPWTDLVGQAMEDGKIDAAVGTPSLQASLSLVSGVDVKPIIPPDKLWPNNPSYGIIAARGFMEQNREALLEFLKIHESLTGFIKAHPKEAARATAGLVGVAPPDFFEYSYRISPRYCAALPDSYIASTMKFVETLSDLGYISRCVEAEEIFDKSFIDVTHPESDHYDDPQGFINGEYPWLAGK
ncbi:MAG: ABC transporter substrate-binding protein [Nitrospinota bacterium]|nr:ABC transporter substrate-binding protein [Nitrospinota bacterium]